MRPIRAVLPSLLTVLVAALWSALAAPPAAAHEVRPAIADFTVTDGTFAMEIRLGAEPIVAGVDLEGVENTNATDAADEVDALRALPPEELAERIRAMRDVIIDAVEVSAGDSPVPLTLDAVEVGPVGNIELPRDTVLELSGPVPAEARELRVTWPADYGTLVLRQQGVENPATSYLEGGAASEPIALAGGGADSAWGAFAKYIPVGFEHIVPMGLDHILFVLGLFFLSPRLKPLLWQVTAFTAAHTVTLALGALGLVNVPGWIVEPIIAASIVYVAVENILSRGLSPWRPAVVFAFGLLHGLGFASVLQEFGLPPGQFVPALLGFNVGVEIGQLFVVAVAFAAVWVALRVDRLEVEQKTGQAFYGVMALVFVALAFLVDGPRFAEVVGYPPAVILGPLAALAACCVLAALRVDRLEAYRTFVAVPASAAIGVVGAWWFVERVFL